METTPKLAVRVGIFIVVGVLLLLGLSLRVQRYLFRKPTGVYAYALFKDIKGLEIGAPVLLAGLEVGSVTALKFDPQKAQVEVTMFIRDPYRLKQDSKASICLKSLLGQYYMNVEFGNPASPDLPYGGTVASVEATDINKVLATVSDMGKDVKELASKLNQNVEKVSHQITSLIEENRENIKKTTESFASIAPRIDAAIDTFNDVITNVKRGKGTIGKLFADDSLYWRISSAADTHLYRRIKRLRRGDFCKGAPGGRFRDRDCN